MSKRKTVIKTDRGVKIFKAPAKFRVGNRKSGRSALIMTTADLLKELTSGNNKRAHDKIRTVLNKRGVDFKSAE